MQIKARGKAACLRRVGGGLDPFAVLQTAVRQTRVPARAGTLSFDFGFRRDEPPVR